MQLPAPGSETALLDWLLTALKPMNRTRVKQLLRAGRVVVNDRATTRHDHPLHPGDRITIVREDATFMESDQRKSHELTVNYVDDAVIVIEKPAGLLTVATESEKLDTAFARLKAQLERQRAGRPHVVHRLDRETSGLLLFARSAEVRDRLQANWDHVTKTYLALVEGQPKPSAGMVDNFLSEGRDLRVRVSHRSNGDAKQAITAYRQLATRGQYSLVEVELRTGRKHQIRVHLSGLGCPIIGDDVYGASTNPARRLGLHAWRLTFEHPRTGKRIGLEARYPEPLGRIVGLPPEPPTP
jgi:23S rRNA pseudouridine1911/1915/1917 synthase